MKTYRKKPVEIQAVLFTGTNQLEVATFVNNDKQPEQFVIDPERGLSIETLEGVMKVSPGDYVIRGVKGEHYPCKPDIFKATYDLVGDDNGEMVTCDLCEKDIYLEAAFSHPEGGWIHNGDCED